MLSFLLIIILTVIATAAATYAWCENHFSSIAADRSVDSFSNGVEHGVRNYRYYTEPTADGYLGIKRDENL